MLAGQKINYNANSEDLILNPQPAAINTGAVGLKTIEAIDMLLS